MILQLHGDGGDTETRDFPSGTCAAKVACVLTSAGGRGRRHIITLVGWFLLASGILQMYLIHKVDGEYKSYSFGLLLAGGSSMEDCVIV